MTVNVLSCLFRPGTTVFRKVCSCHELATEVASYFLLRCQRDPVDSTGTSELTAPACIRLMEALKSLSMTRPHASHLYVRSSSPRLAFTKPQQEHLLEDGKNLSTMICRWALYETCLMTSPIKECARLRLKGLEPFSTIPSMSRFSVTTIPWFLVTVDVNL